MLRQFQIIPEHHYTTLHRGYLLLRNLIDGLRIVHGDATDLVLPDEDSAEFKSLARRLGYKESDRVKASAQLHGDAPAPSSKARREMLRIRRPPDCNLPCFRHK